MKRRFLLLKIYIISIFLGTGVLNITNKAFPQVNVWFPRFAGMFVTFVVAMLLIKCFKFNES